MARTAVTVFLIVGVCSAICGGAARADSEADSRASSLNIIYGAQQAFKVTIKSPEGTTAVVEFPIGVLLSLKVPADGNPRMPDALALPGTFRGDIEIRARREDELKPDEGRGARKMMANAPVVMDLRDVTVEVVEVVGQ